MELPDLDQPCGAHFIYRDFCECSDTWKAHKIDNTPKELETYESIRDMCREILDPVWREFGEVKLTYGFSSPALVNLVKKQSYPNITPSGDQHSGSEINRNGKRICSRLGISVDFYVKGVSSLQVAQWVVKNTNFDRLYFYSSHRPFHVSVGPECKKKIVLMDGYRGGRHQPINRSVEQFLSLDEKLN
ncbi:peptidase M15 [Marinobacterium lacunae]|uniref:peptidase M15 n=1 Tax=Marinobacterium lacunae TaxID=1232683 RepID=UPI0012DEEC86|nr:peptidase M15 [Marinobacterium lacunae]